MDPYDKQADRASIEEELYESEWDEDYVEESAISPEELRQNEWSFVRRKCICNWSTVPRVIVQLQESVTQSVCHDLMAHPSVSGLCLDLPASNFTMEDNADTRTYYMGIEHEGKPDSINFLQVAKLSKKFDKALFMQSKLDITEDSVEPLCDSIQSFKERYDRIFVHRRKYSRELRDFAQYSTTPHYPYYEPAQRIMSISRDPETLLLMQRQFPLSLNFYKVDDGELAEIDELMTNVRCNRIDGLVFSIDAVMHEWDKVIAFQDEFLTLIGCEVHSLSEAETIPELNVPRIGFIFLASSGEPLINELDQSRYHHIYNPGEFAELDHEYCRIFNIKAPSQVEILSESESDKDTDF